MLLSFFSLPDWEDVFIVFKQICLSIDTVIYNAIAWMYSVFMALAGARIFTTDLINSFVQRMYLIVSIVMLFIVAYSFLNVIINPDNLTKGNSSPTKIVTNVVKALAIIILVPSAFSFAFSLQKSIVKENVIGKLVLGTKKKVDVDTFDKRSADFAVTLFESNFYQVDTSDLTTNAYNTASEDARTNNNIGEFSKFLTKTDHEKVQYNFIIAGIVGIYVLYTLLIFSIDLGIRVIKLFFYEIIAPMPALLMLVPGQDKAFKNWTKMVLKCFADLFIKIAIISFGVYIINMLSDAFKNGGTIVGFEATNRNVVFFARVFIILGVIAFMKKAPKLIEDLFGFKLDENGLSLKKRWDDIVTSPILSATVGTAAGVVAGATSSIKGARARGGSAFWAGLGGAFHGGRLGFGSGLRGSYKGIGDAYNYGWANQQAWAHMDPSKGYLANQLSVAGEMLRDNFGMQSYYDDLKDAARIEHDVITTRNNKMIQAIDKEYSEKAKVLDGKYEFKARNSANEAFMNVANKSNDTAKAEVYKDGYSGTTSMWVPVWNDASGHYELQQQQVSASQFARIKETMSDAISKGDLVGQEQAILGELDSAEKRLKNDYDTNTLIAERRDKHTLSTAIQSSYIDSYVENMKSQKHWDGTNFVDFDSLSSAQQTTLKGRWRTDAAAQYASITASNSDFKTNLSHANELHEVLDFVKMTSSKGDARGFIKEAAGQSYNSSTGKFEVAKALSDINTKTDTVISGVDIQAAIKAVKNMNIDGERNSVYRSSEAVIKVNGEKKQMSEAQHVRQSLIDENKQADKDLEDKMLSLKPDEQTSEAARKIGKFRAHGNDSGKK